jgi:hypothetical protein
VAQDKDKLRALVNAIMKIRVLYSAGKLPSGYKAGGVCEACHTNLRSHVS